MGGSTWGGGMAMRLPPGNKVWKSLKKMVTISALLENPGFVIESYSNSYWLIPTLILADSTIALIGTIIPEMRHQWPHWKSCQTNSRKQMEGPPSLSPQWWRRRRDPGRRATEEVHWRRRGKPPDASYLASKERERRYMWKTESIVKNLWACQYCRNDRGWYTWMWIGYRFAMFFERLILKSHHFTDSSSNQNWWIFFVLGIM